MFLLCFTILFLSNLKSSELEVLASVLLDPILSTEHAIYIGILHIDHLQNSARAELSIKVFQDDLQDALRQTGDLKKIEHQADFYTVHEKAIEQYFQKHIQCQVNQQVIDIHLKKGKAINDVYQFYFDLNCPQTWTSMDIQANFLMELFPAQSNIVQLNDGNNKRFGRLTKSMEKLHFDF